MAKDIIHHAVKNALIKDGWTITADPFKIEYGEIKVQADIAAERRPFAAIKSGRKIVVEIKSFLGASLVYEFERALGQYRFYPRLLSAIEPETEIWLAISEDIYESFFTGLGIQFIVQTEDISLVSVNIEKEEIVQWIK